MSQSISIKALPLPGDAPAMAPFGNILVDPKYYVDDYAAIDFSKKDQVDSKIGYPPTNCIKPE